MPINHRKNDMLWVFAALLLLGFSVTSFFSYFTAKAAHRETIKLSTLPLTSDNIYSEIQRDILPTVVISSLMAQDTFVRDWALSGEQDPALITRYLNSIQEKYQTETAFFISDRSLRYYHSTTVLRYVDPEKADDDWYFRAKDMAEDFEINVDSDFLTAQKRNFFVNHKMFDYQDSFLGIIGVGLATDTISNLIENYQQKFNRQVFFVSSNGEVVMHGKNFAGATILNQRPGYREQAAVILNQATTDFSYQINGEQMMVTTRYIPELDWYLLVEERAASQPILTRSLWINLAFSLLISMVVLWLTRITLSRYQGRLEKLANTDSLTQLDNRFAFEHKIIGAVSEAQNKQQALCLILVDLDHFKTINDQYGHLNGDAVLKQFAAILKARMPSECVTCRWGGEEFILLMPDTDLLAAEEFVHHLMSIVRGHAFQLKNAEIKLTFSCGLSKLKVGEQVEDLLKRTDKALYQAKEKGRDRLVVL